MPHLSLRDLRPSDAKALHAIVSDWQVARQLGSWPWPADFAFTQSRCESYEGSGFVWGVFLSDQLIGTVGVTKGDLGYCLASSAWGQGFATRIANLAIDHGFRDPALAAITASVWDDNEGSPRVLKKIGFTYVYTDQMHALARGEETTCHHYELTRARYHRLRSGAQ